jgi:hypothetical protein
LDGCTVCGRRDRRYMARNMCHACYESERRIRLKRG